MKSLFTNLVDLVYVMAAILIVLLKLLRIEGPSGRSFCIMGNDRQVDSNAREPRYASRLVQDLIYQHLRFAPGLDKGEFGDLFEKVTSGISQQLLKYTTGEASQNTENKILAAMNAICFGSCSQTTR